MSEPTPPPRSPTLSRNLVDRRKATQGGAMLALGVMLGVCGDRAVAPGGPDADMAIEVSAALDRGQDFWLRVVGPARWRDARAVLIDSPVRTACGRIGPPTGPVYCPADGRMYVDLTFLRAIDGELARAYVIAHELGHHVQRVTGAVAGDAIEPELGADCLAGAWMRAELEAGHVTDTDIAAALAEAAAVGDDRICPACSPEQWTHGSAEQRVDAVLRGLNGECR